MKKASCPALFISAPASGQGKTTVTAALVRLLKKQGKLVRVFKTGPDYLDPQILQQASGQPVEPLDMWMAGEEYCQQKLFEAAQVADLILIEGAMGLYDGSPSSADLAARFNIPLIILMDVSGMAQTAAAIAVGLANHREDIAVVGLIANNCGSDYHRQLIADALPAELPLLLTLPRSKAITLPERHLGLVQASEVYEELELCLDAGADLLESAGLDENGVEDLLAKLQVVEFSACQWPDVKPLLQGVSIGIAQDVAFSFIYQSNVQLLRDMGADIVYFSPLTEQVLPSVDALWLPGGYPELHAEKLSNNHVLNRQIKDFFLQDKPILAECGGLLYCLQTLTDLQGRQFPMVGLLEGGGVMRDRGGCQGMQSLPLPEGLIRAHAHHRSFSSGTPEPIACGVRQRHPAPGEEIYRQRGLTASYLHLFFPSNPEAIAKLFRTNAL